MSEEKAEKKPKATLEQIMALVAAQQEELKKSSEEQQQLRGQIRTMAEALVQLNQKIEAGKGGNPDSEGSGILATLRDLAGAGKGGTVEDFAKQAEGMARAAEALDRFRNPSRIGMGEALLMRAGLRAIYPRYMTKTEIEKAEKALGSWEVLEGEEEGEHVRE